MLRLFQEVDISRGNDADQASAHLTVVRNRDATKTVSSFSLEDVPNPFIRTHHHWIGNETLFVPLSAREVE